MDYIIVVNALVNKRNEIVYNNISDSEMQMFTDIYNRYKFNLKVSDDELIFISKYFPKKFTSIVNVIIYIVSGSICL